MPSLGITMAATLINMKMGQPNSNQLNQSLVGDQSDTKGNGGEDLLLAPVQDPDKVHQDPPAISFKHIYWLGGAEPGSTWAMLFATASYRRTMIFLITVTFCFMFNLARLFIKEYCKGRRSAEQKASKSGSDRA